MIKEQYFGDYLCNLINIYVKCMTVHKISILSILFPLNSLQTLLDLLLQFYTTLAMDFNKDSCFFFTTVFHLLF